MRRKNIRFLIIILLCSFICGGAFSLQKATDAPFGVCVNLTECKDIEIPVLIKKAGISWVRQQVRWDCIEPAPGEFFWEDFDEAVENEYKSGLNIYGQLHWYRWSNPTTGDEKTIKDWINFVTLAVGRYKDKIKYWEVWNEPDYSDFWNPPDAANYTKLLRATYMAAKKIDPDCKIILGGIMGWGGEHTVFPFLDEVYKNGGKDYFDIVSFHPHTMSRDPEKDDLLKRKIDDIIERMRTNGDAAKPVWITELGWCSNKPANPDSGWAVTVKQQAEYLASAFKICLSCPQIKKVFWYGFRDVGTNPQDIQDHFGLVKNDFTPKPSYFAYKDFISQWKKTH